MLKVTSSTRISEKNRVPMIQARAATPIFCLSELSSILETVQSKLKKISAEGESLSSHIDAPSRAMIENTAKLRT